MDDASLYQMFRSVDRDGSGAIKASELQQALGNGGLHFSLQTVNMMVSMYDRDRSRTLGFDEFKELHKFIGNIKAAFQHFDRD